MDFFAPFFNPYRVCFAAHRGSFNPYRVWLGLGLAVFLGAQFNPKRTHCGGRVALDGGHQWDLDVQLQSDAGHVLAVRWDASQRQLLASEALHCAAVQLSMTISGDDDFRAALEHAFF